MGRRVEVRADLSRVQIRCDGRSVADHERFWVRHQREGLVSSGPGGYRQAARAGR